MEPTVQVKHVRHQEDERDQTCPALPNVSLISRELIIAEVGFSRLDNPHAKDCVEQKREENTAPFDDRQCRSERVNVEDRPLERLGPVEKAGVGRQVDAHVEPQRHDAKERVQATNRKFVTNEKGLRASEFGHAGLIGQREWLRD